MMISVHKSASSSSFKMKRIEIISFIVCLTSSIIINSSQQLAELSKHEHDHDQQSSCPILIGQAEQVESADKLEDKNQCKPRSGIPSTRVYVDHKSSRRRFNASIVAVFSCYENSSTTTFASSRSTSSLHEYLDNEQTHKEHFFDNDLTLDIRLAKPAIELAIRALNDNSSLSGVNFRVAYRSTPDVCRHQQAGGHAADEFLTNGATLFLGPGCTNSLVSMGQLASYWNLPMCSTGFLPEIEAYKFKPMTMIQLSLSIQSVGEMFLELFRRYEWSHLVIITDDLHPLHSIILQGLLDFFSSLERQNSLSELRQGDSNQEQYEDENENTSRTSSLSRWRQRRPNIMTMTNSNNINNNNNNKHQTQYQSQSQSQSHPQPQPQSQPQTNAQTPLVKAQKLVYKNNSLLGSNPIDYEQTILEASNHSHVMLLLAASNTVQHLLRAAHKHQMSWGQYVFIAHELFGAIDTPATQPEQVKPKFWSNVSSSSLTNEQKQKEEQVEDIKHEQNNDAPKSRCSFNLENFGDKLTVKAMANNDSDVRLQREIYSPLMLISLKIPFSNNFVPFVRELTRLSELEFKHCIDLNNLKSLYSLGVAALVYDCVQLYANRASHLLENTNKQYIDGKSIFEATANMTFTSNLTGYLSVNEAGQRVIDFSLNTFINETLSFEPRAHFVAMRKQLDFIPNTTTYWEALGLEAPTSDPRCISHNWLHDSTTGSNISLDGLSRSKKLARFGCKLDDSTAMNHFGSSHNFWLGRDSGPLGRFALGLWVLVVLVPSVALSSSLVGWLIYRHFRIESELLNLWWSIKYDDIIFEDDVVSANDKLNAELSVMKRSISSLAMSTDSLGQQNQNPISDYNKQLHPSPVGDMSAVARDTSSLNLIITSAPIEQRTSGSPTSIALPSVASSPSFEPAEQSCFINQAGQSQSQHETRDFNLDASSWCANINSNSNSNINSNSILSKNCDTFNKQSKNVRHKSKSNPRMNSGQRRNYANTSTNVHDQHGAKDPSISSQNKNIKLKLGTVLNGGLDQQFNTKIGLYKASRVAAKHLNVRNLNVNRQLLIELRQVRDLTHENLIKFIGLCAEEPRVAIVSELCTRGNLQDLLQNDAIRLDWPFRYSIINDIVDGLQHLHSSPIEHHGRLKSSNCVIDNRFVVKLTDFGLPSLMAAIELDEQVVNPRHLLWTAPEHLRTKHPLLSGSAKGDIYSLSIILQEIITRCGPFECEPILCAPPGFTTNHAQHQTMALMSPASNDRHAKTNNQYHQYDRQKQQQQQQPFMMMQPMVMVQHKQRLEPEEIVNLVRMGLCPPFRPYFRPDLISNYVTNATSPNSKQQQQQHESVSSQSEFNVPELIKLVQSCWQESPAARPSIGTVKQQIKKTRRGHHIEGSNLMDNLLQRMERYTDNLETLVEQKTAELMEEKKRSEELLYEMLPRFVVDQLKYGHSVTPEAYEAVTISFSDIKDFTSIAAQSSPIEVVNLLNHLYTEFDDCIARYDVYKVETIGDAYMVVSGLPIRNGNLHASQIADMSLALLDLIGKFEIVHLPNVKVELRIGIHSGPCASGVVGTKMFRYCLFGDTVNTASRMESHGEPMKIHISEETANILRSFGTFTIEPRGLVDIKGKGFMSTYWLTGKRTQLMPKS